MDNFNKVFKDFPLVFRKPTTFPGMKVIRIAVIWVLCLFTLGSFEACRASYYKVPVVKSKKRFRPYDQKKDRRKKRTKIKKYKSLERTRKINEN